MRFYFIFILMSINFILKAQTSINTQGNKRGIGWRRRQLEFGSARSFYVFLITN